jgi:hypothetical protein
VTNASDGGGRIRARAAAPVAEAGLELVAHAHRLLGYLLVLADEQPHAPDGEEVERRRGGRHELVIVA